MALNLALIPVLGIQGAAISTALSGGVYLAMMALQLRPFRTMDR